MKKKLPLSLIQHFKPEYGDNIAIVKPSKEDTFIARFEDSDPESDFYFTVVQFNPSRNDFVVKFKPVNGNNLNESNTNLTADKIGKYFDLWYKVINDFDSAESFLDDPITNGHAENYLREFEFVEDENSNKPFEVDKILLLEAHLTDLIKGVKKLETEENQEAVEEIVLESQELIDSLTTKSRKWILKRLTNLWAKITAQGVSFAKEFFNEAKRKAITGGLNKAVEIISESFNS